MKKGIVKVIVLLLVTALTVTMLSSCSNKGASTDPGQSSKQDTPAATPTGSANPGTKVEDLTFPIVKDPITITIFWALNPKATASIKDYSEMTLFKELEKKTNIKAKFVHPPVGKENEQFNLMWASNDFPDVIWWGWFGVPGGPQKMLDDGFITPLNEYIDKYAPNLKKIMTNPKVDKDIKTDDGKIYTFPCLRVGLNQKGVWGFLIREDWLNKAGLKKPQTIDEWYNALKAFKTQDPNGNGKPDELPFASWGLGRTVQWLYAWGINNDFYNDNGKIKYGPAQPEYKDALMTLSKWYKEGLIDPDYSSTDSKQMDAKVLNNVVGSYWGETGGFTGMYIKTFRTTQPTAKIIGVQYPVAKQGMTAYNYNADPLFSGYGVSFSTKNKYLKECTKYFDYWYSDEGNLLVEFGIPGLTYNMVNGIPTLSDYVLNNPDGLSIDQALAKHCFGSMDGPKLFNKYIRDQRMLFFPEQKESLPEWDKAETNRMMPPIIHTEAESSRVSAIMSEINTYRDEMFNKFVMGREPLDNYDKYIETLKKMGIDEAIQLKQAALDRYAKRK